MSSRANYYAKSLSVCPNGERISRSEKFVLMVLADAHQDGAHLRTYPKVRTIAEDAMVSERQCQRIFAALERKGVLRREYPNGVGRDRLTYYIFPELDEQEGTVTAVTMPARKPAGLPVEQPEAKAKKGDILTPMFGQEGRQKGDRRVTLGAPHLINKNNKSNGKDKDSPQPPVAGGSVAEDAPSLAVNRPGDAHQLEVAVNEVMKGCGWVRRRIRGVVRRVMQLRMNAGEPWAMVAARMVANWDEQAAQYELGTLRVMYGPEKFVGDGLWDDTRLWAWDQEKLDRMREARVGVR